MFLLALRAVHSAWGRDADGVEEEEEDDDGRRLVKGLLDGAGLDEEDEDEGGGGAREGVRDGAGEGSGALKEKDGR